MKKGYLFNIISIVIWLAAITSILVVSDFAIFKKEKSSSCANNIPVHRETTKEENEHAAQLTKRREAFLKKLPQEITEKLKKDEYQLFLTLDERYVIKDAKTKEVILEEEPEKTEEGRE